MCSKIVLHRLLCFNLLPLLGWTHAQELLGSGGIVDLEDVQFELYNSDNTLTPAIVNPNVPGGVSSVSPGRTVIFVPGYTKSNVSVAERMLREAYLFRGDVNFIHVSWWKLCRGTWSFTTANMVEPMAKHLAGFIDRLVLDQILKLGEIHVIGFGLGAQIAGVTANYINSGKVDRITALDPTKHFFENVTPEQRLDESDAEFVDVIHTSGSIISYEAPLGHADFYPNGGSTPQPLCVPILPGNKLFFHPFVMLMCSHVMSIFYYIKSVYRPDVFPAWTCESWAAATVGRCNINGTTTLMGHATPTGVRGIFYVNISDASRFSESAEEEEQEEESQEAEEHSSTFKHSPDGKSKKFEGETKKKHWKVHRDKFGANMNRLWEEEEEEIRGPSVEAAVSKEELVNSTAFDEDNLPEQEGGLIAEVRNVVGMIEEHEEPHDHRQQEDHSEDPRSYEIHTERIVGQVYSGAGTDVQVRGIASTALAVFIYRLFMA